MSIRFNGEAYVGTAPARRHGSSPSVDDRLLLEMAGSLSTPLFVFDEDAFRGRVREVRRILGGSVSLCYSMKANPFLVPAACAEGLKIEVCSPGELTICEALDVPPESIVYSGVCKQPDDVDRAIWYESGVLTAESPNQLRIIDREARERGTRVPVLLRLSAGSQFGMTKADLVDIIDRRAEYPGVDLVGIHYFVGTQRDKTRRQVRELGKLRQLLGELEAEHGWHAERLEYGPGLCVPYFVDEDFSDTLRPAREVAGALREIASEVSLTVEMGRFLASDCGWYLTRVVDMKDGDGIRYAFVDGGINHVNYHGQMMGMRCPGVRNLSALLSVTDEDALSNWDIIDNGDDPPTVPREDGPWCLCGSLCTTNDILVRSLDLPLAMGDILAFSDIGAYSVTEGLYLFLSRDMPVIAIVRDGKPILARNAVQTSIINTAGIEITL